MALVTPLKPELGVHENKENGPEQLDTPPSATQSGSRQRVVFSERNKEHWFPPLLPANPTPSSTQEPSKSILKKRTYEEFLADDLFPAERTQRASTPEPEDAQDQPTYLLSPIKTLVQSIAPGTFKDVTEGDIRDLIEAYCVLGARVRAKLLTPETTNKNGLLPALEPLKQYMQEITDVLTRDILKARNDPIQSLAKMGVQPVVQALPSPPPSSPLSSTFDSSPLASSVKSDGTPKKGGMNEQQVKHARDLCTLAQSAIKCFSALICFTEFIHAKLLFTDSQLASLVGAVISIPLASPLPTPNSRKTCALAVGIINSFSTLPINAVSPHCNDIAAVYKRGISGELGREGKKGSTGDALRGVVLYTVSNAQQFAHPFGVLLAPLLKLLNGPAGNIQSQAGYAFTGLAYASTEVATPIPGVSDTLREYLTFKQKQKNTTADLPPILVSITKHFQSAIMTGTADTVKDSKTTPAMQAACQTTALWALSVFSAFVVLADRAIFKDKLTTIATTKIMRVLLTSKRVGVRTAASWGWRAFAWACLREFNELDVERQDERVGLIRRIFDFLEKGVATVVLCALLVGSDGREDRETRIDMTIEALLDIAKKRSTADEATRILNRLLSDEEFVGGNGPSIGWDFNKLLPSCLFDGSLAEADGKALHTIIENQKEIEKDWADDIPPMMQLEVQDRLEDLFEIWQCAVKGYGVDDKGYPTPFVADTWVRLLRRTRLIPEARVLAFVTEPPYTWTNLAQPGPVRSQQIAHQVVQARYIKCLWLGLIKRFGASKEMRQLALQIYDHALSIFDLDEGKVEDVCLEMFYFLAEVESSIVVLMMGHEEWTAEMKHTFWTKACKAAKDEDLMRTLCVVPFGEPAPFELGEDDWVVWEDTWKQYIGVREGSRRGRVAVLTLFCEELGSNLTPRDATRIAGHVLDALPLPLPPSNLKAVLSFINQSFSVAYETHVRKAIEVTITNLRTITDVLPHLELSSLIYVTPSLVQWISDEEGIMDDREYDIIIGQTYAALLECVASEPVTLDTLEAHCELICCITKRITPGLRTVTVFQRFWATHCADFTFDDVPREMCPLLLVMGEFSSQQASADGEQSQEVEEGADIEPPSDDAVGSSDEVLSLLANADALGSDDTFNMYPTLEDQGVTDDEVSNDVEESQDVSCPAATALESIDGDDHGTAALSLRAHLEALDLGAPEATRSPLHFLSDNQTLFGAFAVSPSSKKRRSMDDEECTPVKRRRQEEDEEEVDDRTPVKPWFGEVEDGKTQDTSLPIPFVPFTKHNLPNGIYHFSGEPGQGSSTSVAPAFVPAHRNLCMAPAAADVFTPLFVESAAPQHGNPSSKRRRVRGSETPLALEMAPYSDDALPSSDPVKPEPGSDDSIPSGDFSPEAIVSPPMASAEPGSDDSHESPLKAMLERKKRSMETRMRLEGSLSMTDNRQVLVDQEARNAMTRASSLLSSMDKSSLLQMSGLLEQMRSKVQDELRRKAGV